MNNYWENLEYEILDNCIVYSKYPFKCSHAYQNAIHAEDILEANINSYGMPTIRIKQDELIFISAVDKDKLATFCEKNNLPVVQRIDVWELVLDVFLDSYRSPEMTQRVYDLLQKCGISKEECNNLRKEVAQRMCAYNDVLWEWVHLGLCDLLSAYQGNYPKPLLDDNGFKDFYFKTMRIAFKGV
ncbi:MAG: hypothetical protein FWC89_08090 [Defluviitaleaceae bacterium]|nr:hypothetical protein [Defluviitaleaceae bacterium]